jgi:hypothetical protein
VGLPISETAPLSSPPPALPPTAPDLRLSLVVPPPPNPRLPPRLRSPPRGSVRHQEVGGADGRVPGWSKQGNNGGMTGAPRACETVSVDEPWPPGLTTGEPRQPRPRLRAPSPRCSPWPPSWPWVPPGLSRIATSNGGVGGDEDEDDGRSGEPPDAAAEAPRATCVQAAAAATALCGRAVAGAGRAQGRYRAACSRSRALPATPSSLESQFFILFFTYG